ncbi:Tyrosine specific protein phosphatase-like [Zea mays]|nr:Tyrosine specific protein phosphatase-like [Zea mays]
MTSEEHPSSTSSDGSTTIGSDEHLDSPPSPSTFFDSPPESDDSAASSLLSDGSSESEPIIFKKPRPPVRSWPASDEIAILETVASHRQKHGRLPLADDLAAAVRGRLSAGDRLSAAQITRRLCALRNRYDNTVIRLKRGTIPAKDSDVTIYRLSKLIWEGTRRGRIEKKTRVPDARNDPRGFDDLAELYPCLSAEVEAIGARCGYGALKRAFGRIGDDTAARLEAKLKRQRMAETRASGKLDRLRYRDILLAVIVSCYFKLFLFTMMVWEFPSSVIFIVEMFVF